MKIFIQAKLNSKKQRIEKIDDSHFIVAVKEPPIKGRANEAIIKVLADYFNLSPSQVKIISGYASRRKIILISS